MILQYSDERFGDTFVIDFDVPDGTIHSITRFIDGRIGDPQRYDTIAEAPTRVQDKIDAMVTNACQQSKQK